MEVLQRTANRGSISTASAYEVDNSLKFETDNTEYLMAEGRPQGNQKTWTWSCWLKRTEVNNGVVAQHIFSAAPDGNTKVAVYFRDDASYPGDRIFIYVDEGNTLKWIGQVNQSFRDTSAWYHIVFAVDSTDSTPADRTKIYVNGVQQTITFNATLNQNVSTRVGDGGGKFAIGGKVGNTAYGFNGYMAECVLVDGFALTPTSFGEFDDDSGIWKPKDVSSLSLGTTGFYMNFDDSSDLGKVQPGTSQGDFDLYNITAADQATDTPTNNFATGNAVVYFSNPTFATFNPITEGGTKITKGAGGWETLSSTIAVTSGKWYMEMQNISVPESAMMSVFPADIEFLYQGGQINNYAGKVSGDGGISYYSYNGNVYQNASNTSYGVSWANETNTMAIALDMDNGKVYFARANTWQNSGDPTSGATGTGAIDLIEPSKPHMMGYSIYAQNTSGAVNFGGYTPSSISSAASDANGYGTFEYAPPSGYYAL